ncbi:ATP-binding protein [Arenibacter sp. F20364]|uniref:sensor histidine kinase n=1 Tax=Arenibacter sp. F20364 TaxID=2926415 RepID=UPI001FF2A879|nr:ATP-binding protein [Arenibacter sp. F20364]MCK0192102.1 ATP-binding protein [Arenibacter sp. F20364]
MKELNSYSILDTLPESDYDNLTTIAAEICGTPISLISLIDDKRQWFKSHHGVDASETPKEYAFCGHAINTPNDVFIVQDARKDERFHDNPLVIGDPHVIFYAGVPLVGKAGLPLGTLCVIDHKPNLLSQSQIRSLSALSKQVMNLLELRKNELLLEQAIRKLEERNEGLERFALVAAHDLKTPLINISSLAQLFRNQYKGVLDDEGLEMLELIVVSSDNLIDLIEGLLHYSRAVSILREEKSNISLKTLIKDITGLFNYDHNLNLVLKSDLTHIMVNKTGINQILINLVTNAIKYNDKEVVEIELGIEETDTHYLCYLKDNGPGIAKEYQEKIFKIFEKIAATDKFGKRGNGIGLATVKKIVETSGGSITVESDLGKGTKFIFTLEK